MALKNLLGLEGSALHDKEIMARFALAKRQGKQWVEFSCPKGVVRVHVTSVTPQGIMREYQDYYAQ